LPWRYADTAASLSVLAFRRWFHARGLATLVVMRLGLGQQPEFRCAHSLHTCSSYSHQYGVALSLVTIAFHGAFVATDGAHLIARQLVWAGAR
jgi:hypothetical protein